MTDIPVSKLAELTGDGRLELAVANIEEELQTMKYEYRTIEWDLRELKAAFLKHKLGEADRDGEKSCVKDCPFYISEVECSDGATTQLGGLFFGCGLWRMHFDPTDCGGLEAMTAHWKCSECHRIYHRTAFEQGRQDNKCPVCNGLLALMLAG